MAKQEWYIPTKTVYLDIEGEQWEDARDARRSNDETKARYMEAKVRDKVVEQLQSINSQMNTYYEIADTILSGSIDLKLAKHNAEEDFKSHYNL